MHKRPGYSAEVHERAVGLAPTGEHEHPSRWAALQSIATRGCTPETLRSRVNTMEVDTGAKPGVTSAQSKRMKALERENRELKRASEILKKAAHGWQRQAAMHRLAAWANLTTMRRLRPSTGCTRQR